MDFQTSLKRVEELYPEAADKYKRLAISAGLQKLEDDKLRAECFFVENPSALKTFLEIRFRDLLTLQETAEVEEEPAKLQLALREQTQLRLLVSDLQHKVNRLESSSTQYEDLGQKVLAATVTDAVWIERQLSVPCSSLSPKDLEPFLPALCERLDRMQKKEEARMGQLSYYNPAHSARLEREFQATLKAWLATLPPLPIHIADTHKSGYLQNPICRADFTVLVDKQVQVVWANMLMLWDLNVDLTDKWQRLYAVGKAREGAEDSLESQQFDRALCYALLLSPSNIEVLYFTKDGKAVSTGVLPFKPAEPTSQGVQLFLKLLCASPTQLGYVPPKVPASFTAETPDNKALEVKEVKLLVTKLVGSPPHPAFWANRVYLVKCCLQGGRSQQAVLKVTLNDAFKEAKILDALNRAGVPGVPTVLARGTLQIGWGMQYTIMTPVGQRMYGNLPPRKIIESVRDWTSTLQQAFLAGFLHLDPSVGNLLCDGLVIDWQTAARVKQVSRASNTQELGTELYRALTLHFQSGPPSCSTDLEGVMYSILDIITGHRLPWRHSLARQLLAKKHLVMHVDQEFDYTVLDNVIQRKLKPFAQQLRDLFFPRVPGTRSRRYRDDVTYDELIQLCDSCLVQLGQPKTRTASKTSTAQPPAKRGRPRKQPPALAGASISACVGGTVRSRSATYRTSYTSSQSRQLVLTRPGRLGLGQQVVPHAARQSALGALLVRTGKHHNMRLCTTMRVY